MRKKRFLLKDAPKGKEFVLKEGLRIKNLLDLSVALHDMSDDIFFNHVTDDRNDFAAWVNDVFDEKELALELGMSKNMYDHELILLKHGIKKDVKAKKPSKKKKKGSKKKK